MLEAIGAELVQGSFARMAKRRVAQVVCQADGLGQVLVEPQRPGNGPGHLGHFQRVGQASAVKVTLRREEDLCLLFEAAERLAVDDAVPVPLEHGPDIVRLFLPLPSPARIAERRPGGKGQPLDLFGTFPHIHPQSLAFCSVVLLSPFSARSGSQTPRLDSIVPRLCCRSGEDACLF